MAAIKYCPTCIRKDKPSKLILRQVNFKLAVYLCEDVTCTYPEGYDLVEVKQRSLNELSKKQKHHLPEETDLDRWLEQFFVGEEKKQIEQSSDSEITEDDLSKIIDEISKPPNENDLDLQYDNDSFTWIDNAFEQYNGKNDLVDNKSTNKKQSEDNEIANDTISDKLNDEVNVINEDLNNSLIKDVNDTDNVKDKSKIRSYTNTKPKNKNIFKICDDLSVLPVKTQTPQYQILNFQQFRRHNGENINYEPRKAQEERADVTQNVNTKENVHSNLVLCPDKRKMIYKLHSQTLNQLKSEQTNKFKDFRYIDIIIKPANTK